MNNEKGQHGYCRLKTRFFVTSLEKRNISIDYLVVETSHLNHTCVVSSLCVNDKHVQKFVASE